jgi:hypothetical protein
MPTKGKTDWIPRSMPPVHPGQYECIARIAGGMVFNVGLLDYVEGKGFRVPFPMNVLRYRGMTKKAYDKAITNPDAEAKE